MVNQPGIGLSSPVSHLKSIYHELGVQVDRSKATHHLPGVDIEYEGQVEKNPSEYFSTRHSSEIAL